jgi:hypothetical protein
MVEVLGRRGGGSACGFRIVTDDGPVFHLVWLSVEITTYVAVLASHPAMTQPARILQQAASPCTPFIADPRQPASHPQVV